MCQLKWSWQLKLLKLEIYSLFQTATYLLENNQLFLCRPSYLTIYDDADDELFLWYGWLTKRRLALFLAGTIVRDPHLLESPTRREQDFTWTESEFRLCWVKLCSSDNHYTTAPITMNGQPITIIWRSICMNL